MGIITKTKFEAMEILNKDDIPCGPILSMKEIAEDQSLRATGTVVEVDHPTRGKYVSVGNPIKLSNSPSHVNLLATAGAPTRPRARSRFLHHQVAEIHVFRRARPAAEAGGRVSRPVRDTKCQRPPVSGGLFGLECHFR